MREYVGIKRGFKEKPHAERFLGRYSNGLEGPCLFITADVFGNDFSGVLAFSNVLNVLEKSNLSIKGELIGLAGNIGLPKDLLIDTDQSWPGFSGAGSFILREHQGYNEDCDLLGLIDGFRITHPGRNTNVFHMDIKTCPTVCRPYVCTSRNLSCIRFANSFPLFTVKGLENYVNDRFSDSLREKGISGCTLKVGLNDLFSPAKTQEAAIWLALVNSGCLGKEEVPGLLMYHKILNNYGESKETTAFEVSYRYRIREDEFFRMIPGYSNFREIKKGEILATSDGGSVISEWDGRIFMPLYHTYSRNGFFILKEVD